MPPSPSRPTLLAWTILGLAILAAATLLFLFDPARHAFYPRCPLHSLTGLECPTCGALRALHQLLHGNLRAAYALNPFLFLALPIIALAARRPFRTRGLPWLALAALLAWFLWRNFPPHG